MRDQAIVAVVLRGHRDCNHFSLELGKARWTEHQVVVHGDESLKLRHVERVSLQYIGNETKLLLAFLEIGSHGRTKLGRSQIERDNMPMVVRDGTGSRLGGPCGRGRFAACRLRFGFLFGLRLERTSGGWHH